MGVFRVEPAEGDLIAACACCAGEPGLRGFVFEDETPRAVYFVEPLGVPNYPLAKIAMAFGDWSPGAPKARRIAFAFLCKPGDAALHLTPCEAKMIAFPEFAMLGESIAAEALASHESVQAFDAAIRAVIDQDWRLAPIRGDGAAGKPRSRFSAEPA